MTNSSDLASLKDAEDKLEAANEEAEIEAMESLLADSFSYTGGMGGSQTKAEWLSGLLKRRQSPETLAQEARTVERAKAHNRSTVLLLTGLRVGETTEHQTEIHGDIAIANRCYSILDADGSERCLRYVRVYRLTGAGWRLISHRYIHAVD